MADPVINAKFGLDAGPFRRGMADVRNQTRKAERGINRASKATQKLKGFLAALGVGVGIGAMAGLARRAVNMADDFVNAADAVGTTVEEIQKLRYAEEQTTQTSGALENGLKRLGRRMVQQEKQFNELGISVRDADGNFVSVREGLDRMADAIKNADSQAERLNIAQRGLGTEGRALVPLLQQGSEGLAKYAAEAEKAGRVLDEDTARALSEAKLKMDDFTASVTIGTSTILGKFLEIRKGAIALGGELGELIGLREVAKGNLLRRGELQEVAGGLALPEEERGGFFARRFGFGEGREIDRKIEEEIARLKEQQTEDEKKSNAQRDLAQLRAKRQQQTEERLNAILQERADAREAEIEAARELGRAISQSGNAVRGSIDERRFQELPLAEQILSIEKRIADLREEMADSPADQRVDQVNRLLDLENELTAKRKEAANIERQRRERLAPSLAQVAETETPAGRIARQIQEGEDAARQARIAGFEPGGLGMDRPEAPRRSSREFAGLNPQERADAFREAQRDFAREMEEFAERQREQLRGLIPDTEVDLLGDVSKNTGRSAEALESILAQLMEEAVEQ